MASSPVRVNEAVSFPHLLQIAGMAGRVVVEADDRLVELQQRLEKVGADEAGDTGDQPAARTLPKQLLNFLVPGTRHNRQTVSPARCCGSPASKSGNDRENFVRVSTFTA